MPDSVSSIACGADVSVIFWLFVFVFCADFFDNLVLITYPFLAVSVAALFMYTISYIFSANGYTETTYKPGYS